MLLSLQRQAMAARTAARTAGRTAARSHGPQSARTSHQAVAELPREIQIQSARRPASVRVRRISRDNTPAAPPASPELRLRGHSPTFSRRPMTGSDGFSPRVASPLSFSADPKDTSGSDAPPTIEPLRFVHLLEPQTSGGDLLKASWPSVPHTSAADAALAPAATAAATAAVYPGSHTPSNSPRSSPAHRRPVNVVSLNESNVVVHDSTTGTGPGTPQLYLDAQSDRHNSPALAPRVAAVGGYYTPRPAPSRAACLSCPTRRWSPASLPHPP